MSGAVDIAGLGALDIKPIPYGMVSLGDMINFYYISILIAVLEGLKHQQSYCENCETSDEAIQAREIKAAKDILGLMTVIATRLELDSAIDRIRIFERNLKRPITMQEIGYELRALREAIEAQLDHRYFYHYPREKADMLLGFEYEWARIIAAFPDVKEEGRAAIDCYALGHHTASVFHSMRVAERGLRAIAKERKIALAKTKPIEWANWQDIIISLQKEADAIAKKPPSKQRDRASGFYSGAIADLNAFKNEYRNEVMHARATYDELQALRAYRRVHAFMDRISEKIDHRHHRIRWGLR